MAMFFSFCSFEGLVLVPLLYFSLDFVFRNMFFDVLCHFVDIIFAWILIHTEWITLYSHPSKSIYYSSTSNICHTIFAFHQVLHQFQMYKIPIKNVLFLLVFFQFERFAILHLSLLNESERYYDHKELWVIVKNFSVTHSPPPKQRNYIKPSTSIVQYKYFETLERYFNTSNLRI